MKTSLVLLAALLAAAGVVAAAGAPRMADPFLAQVERLIATSSEDAAPVNVDAIAASAPDDSEPAALGEPAAAGETAAAKTAATGEPATL